jgi:iron complex outermembrane receptor protein
VDHTFDEIVVTATRTAPPLSEVPASVSVVTKEDIEKRNTEEVDTVMDLLPGVFDKRSKGLDTTARVALRGIPDQKRSLVLLDGQPVNEGYTGNLNWTAMLPVNIEKVVLTGWTRDWQWLRCCTTPTWLFSTGTGLFFLKDGQAET